MARAGHLQRPPPPRDRRVGGSRSARLGAGLWPYRAPVAAARGCRSEARYRRRLTLARRVVDGCRQAAPSRRRSLFENSVPQPQKASSDSAAAPEQRRPGISRRRRRRHNNSAATDAPSRATCLVCRRWCLAGAGDGRVAAEREGRWESNVLGEACVLDTVATARTRGRHCYCHAVVGGRVGSPHDTAATQWQGGARQASMSRRARYGVIIAAQSSVE